MASVSDLLSSFTEAFYTDNLRHQWKLHEEIQLFYQTHPSSQKVATPEYEKYMSDLDDIKKCEEYLNSSN